MDHEYAGITGLPNFCSHAADLAFGEGSQVTSNGLVRITFINTKHVLNSNL